MHTFIQRLAIIEEQVYTRPQWKVKHKLTDTPFVVLVATIANADEWFEFEENKRKECFY